jgi:hypothetical protein
MNGLLHLLIFVTVRKLTNIFCRCVSFIEASHKYLYLRHLPTWFNTPQLRLCGSTLDWHVVLVIFL